MYITGYRYSGASVELAGTDPRQLARDFAQLVDGTSGRPALALVRIIVETVRAPHWYTWTAHGWQRIATYDAELLRDRLRRPPTTSTTD